MAAILADERDLRWARAYVDGELLEKAQEQFARVRGAPDKRQALATLVSVVSGSGAEANEPYATWLAAIAKHRARTSAHQSEPSEELAFWLRRLARSPGEIR